MTCAYRIDPLADPRWEKFVERHTWASVFHSLGWLEAPRCTYGYEAVAACTTTPPGIELTNGLVLCHVNGGIPGWRMVSLPFADHCEPLVNRSDDLEALLRSLEIGCRTEGWRYIEMRSRTTCAVSPAGMQPAQSFHFHSVDLSAELEEVFAGSTKIPQGKSFGEQSGRD